MRPKGRGREIITQPVFSYNRQAFPRVVHAKRGSTFFGLPLEIPPVASSPSCVKARDPLNCSYRVIHAPKSLSISATQPIIQYIEPLSGRPNSTSTCMLLLRPLPLPIFPSCSSFYFSILTRSYLLATPHGTESSRERRKQKALSRTGFVSPRFHSDRDRRVGWGGSWTSPEQKGVNGVTFHRRSAS